MRFLLLLLLAKSPQQHSATLSWQDDTNPVGTTFNVYRAPGACSASSAFVRLNPQPIAVKSYVDTSVAANAVYCYAVSAVNGIESAKTPGVTAVIPGNKR